MYTFDQIKNFLLKSIDAGYEAELTLTINGSDYMIIIYENHCSFQKCGIGSKEYNFSTLDELYETVQIDNILLKRDWNKIEKFECYGLDD